MGPVTRALEDPPVALGTIDPKVIGTAFCLFAAVGYTGTNICLRYLADSDITPLAWTMFLRELLGMLGVTPWLLWNWRRGARCWPDAASFWSLAAAGVASEVIGNLGIIWALRVVGLSVAVTVALGVSLTSSAVLGWLVLGERVSRRSALALGMVIVAIVLLKFGADREARLLETGPLWGFLAVAVCVAGGCCYAWLSVSMRKAAMAGAPPPTIAFIATGSGVLTLGPLALWQSGPQGLATIPSHEMNLILLAGTLNIVAFLAMTKGLHLTSTVHANLLSATQVAMAAVAGIVLFKETPNGVIFLGLVLALLGMVLVERPADDEETLSGV